MTIFLPIKKHAVVLGTGPILGRTGGFIWLNCECISLTVFMLSQYLIYQTIVIFSVYKSILYFNRAFIDRINWFFYYFYLDHSVSDGQLERPWLAFMEIYMAYNHSMNVVCTYTVWINVWLEAMYTISRGG